MTKPPPASADHVRRQMQGLSGGRDTGPERALRRELWHRGVRGYRIDRRLPLPGVRRRADITFIAKKVAVFVDGCFWHSCPDHGHTPKTNSSYWSEKFERNVRKDAETDRLANEEGWIVLRVWEHEDIARAADRVQEVVTKSESRRS